MVGRKDPETVTRGQAAAPVRYRGRRRHDEHRVRAGSQGLVRDGGQGPQRPAGQGERGEDSKRALGAVRSGSKILLSGDHHMTLTDLAAIGSFISGVAVVVTLVFLLLQTRQNTRAIRAAASQAHAANYQALLA